MLWGVPSAIKTICFFYTYCRLPLIPFSFFFFLFYILNPERSHPLSFALWNAATFKLWRSRREVRVKVTETQLGNVDEASPNTIWGRRKSETIIANLDLFKSKSLVFFIVATDTKGSCVGSCIVLKKFAALENWILNSSARNVRKFYWMLVWSCSRIFTSARMFALQGR